MTDREKALVEKWMGAILGVVDIVEQDAMVFETLTLEEFAKVRAELAAENRRFALEVKQVLSASDEGRRALTRHAGVHESWLANGTKLVLI